MKSNLSLLGLTNVGRDGNADVPTCEVMADYIYLDTDERLRSFCSSLGHVNILLNNFREKQ